MMRETTCCFTGHRPNRLPWGTQELDPRCLQLKHAIIAALENAYLQGFRHFICGMAQGSDLYFCEAVLLLRETHPEITIEAAIPFPGQTNHWTAAQKQRHHNLLEQCNYETTVQQYYSPGCMIRRNRYMVDHSSLLLSVYDGMGSGGTCNTILYAIQKNVPVVQLPVAQDGY